MKPNQMKTGTLACIVIFFLTVSYSCKKNPVNVQQNVDVEVFDSDSTVDPLPSWNNGTLKQAIIDYVNQVTVEESHDFIPSEYRIATFDNDGTLWPEVYLIQFEFAKYRIAKMIKEKPALANNPSLKALMNDDKAFFEKNGIKAIEEVMFSAMTNITTEAYEDEVIEFFTNFKYPKYDLTFDNIAYRPQLELIQLLQSNGFKVYICTGGDMDFVRAISRTLYDIPAEQVIGSTVKYQYIDNTTKIIRKPELFRFNDKSAKPEGIQLQTGKIPVFACGNERSGGDIEMLQYTQSNTYPSFQLLVNHTDSIREFYYQESDSASLKAAAKNNWHIVDMQKDWKVIF